MLKESVLVVRETTLKPLLQLHAGSMSSGDLFDKGMFMERLIQTFLSILLEKCGFIFSCDIYISQ